MEVSDEEHLARLTSAVTHMPSRYTGEGVELRAVEGGIEREAFISSISGVRSAAKNPSGMAPWREEGLLVGQ